jgi:crossover junction endodeoxyribonuclease RusA
MITFTAYGIPAPKGSTKAFMPRGGRFPIVTADNKRTKPWQSIVQAAAIDAIGGNLILFPDGPVSIAVEFYLPRPKSLPKRVVHHLKKPDCDKCIRSVLDALTGVIWRDDSQVVRIHATKFYASDASMPRAFIQIEEEIK